MAYVITDLCAGVCEGECVDSCPTDAIDGPLDLQVLLGGGPAADALRKSGVQLYINPDDCIDCGACVAVCPTQAIVHEDDLSPSQERFRGINAAFYGLEA
ncbi:MAG: 4Fe-4S binding protein [Planctomycetes bacterium]|nr:4Fe-4S binding protein [Planctomycetota bacterium]